jgi:poly(3-hydroxyalkanoate) synthetase
MPVSVQEWLETGDTIPGNDWDAWQTWVLKYDRSVTAGTKFWTRRDLRDLGYGAADRRAGRSRRMPA